MAFWPKNDKGTPGDAPAASAPAKGNGNGAKSPPPASTLSGIEPIGGKPAGSGSALPPLTASQPPKQAQPAVTGAPSKAATLAPRAAGSTSGDSPAAGENAKPVPPEVAAKITELRNKIQLSVGQIVLSIMNLPRYKTQSLGDLSHLVIEPLLRDRVAIAHKQVKSADGKAKPDEETIAGIAIWATVSDAVDAKITEQVRAGVFPVRMAIDDWTSGDNVWLLDVVAGDRKQATAVLANFRQVAGEKPIKIHPVVARLIDPAVLEKLRDATKTEAGKDGAKATALASKPPMGRA